MSKAKVLLAAVIAAAAITTGTLATTTDAEAKKGWHKWRGGHWDSRYYVEDDDCFYVKKHGKWFLVCTY
jgi:hypothetical protein